MNTNVDVVTEQYVKTKGSWMFNPNVTISIPNVRQSEPGLTFYQTTVDWVKANEGEGYIDRGNSEFFSDVRLTTAMSTMTYRRLRSMLQACGPT